MKTDTQEFISIYNELKAQGPLDEERIIETAKELLDEKLQNRRLKKLDEQSQTNTSSLVENFSEAKKSSVTTPSVSISEIFKD